MDVFDTEESGCFSSATSEESSEESLPFNIWNCTPSSIDSLSDDSCSVPLKHSKKSKKSRPPHFLKKLCFREIGGYCNRSFNDITKPAFQRVKLQEILPATASKLNHVFLGLSKCGQFLLSYTFTTELDVMSFNTMYKYRLHWWAFSPHQKARKVSEVMLFGNQGIYSTLYIAVCQWPMDHNRVLIYGNCFESYLGLVSQAERSYLTITTVPSLNKCQDCLKVAASYEEEDLAANWDSCVRFSCLKHSLTVHSTFDVVSPYPKFEPAVSMKRDGIVVFNTGNQLHMLRAELEHVDNNSSSVNTRVGSSVPDPPESLVVPSSNDNIFQNKQEAEFINGGQEHWIEDIKLVTKDNDDNQNIPHNSCLCNIRSHSVSPSLSSLNGCKDGANVSCLTNCTTNPTSECSIDKTKYEDDDDDIDEDSLPFKDVIEAKHSKLIAPPIRTVSSDCRTVFSNNCDRCGRLNSIQGDEKDSDRRSTLMRYESDEQVNVLSEGHEVNKGNCFKKVCDTLKQCDASPCGPELEIGSTLGRSTREKSPEEAYSGRVTRSQTFRERLELNTEGSLDEDLDGESFRPRKQQQRLMEEVLWGREDHVMDSTQELNISCGIMNASSEGGQSSVTLMSPVQKPLLVVSTTEDMRSEDNHLSPDRRRASTPPRLKRVRYGATVKLSSPMPSLPPSPSPRLHSKMAAEAEKAYEFTEDVPETGCEKLSSYRRRRLADKKYEFCEEGEDAENIVPYRLHRRRESTRLRSPPLHIPVSPLILNHRRRHHEPDAPDIVISGPRSPSNSPYSSLAGDIHPLPQSGTHPDPDKIVLRPLNQNTSATVLLSPRDRDSVASDRSKSIVNKKAPQADIVSVSEEVARPIGGDSGAEVVTTGDAVGQDILENNPARCTVQLKRRYIEVDDELISVITDIEDDDLNESTGYHCALPLEVHGAGYVQLQMISNSKAEKLMAPCVLVMQRSFDIEQFCHEIAERLCEEAGKKYWFCNDYDVEIVDVCPFSGDVIALAMMRIQATVKTKGLAKSQRHPVSSQQRRQYQGGCRFVWNLDTGLYSVVDTKALVEVDPYTEEKDPWNPARELAHEMRENLPHIPVYCTVRSICNKPALRGVSANRLEDLDNMIELVL